VRPSSHAAATLPEVLRGVVKVQEARSNLRNALVTQAPQPPTAVTAPDDLRHMPAALAQRCEPETGLEGVDIPQHGDEPALCQPGDPLACPCAMLAEPSQHAHCDRAPADLAPWGASSGSQRYQDPIGPQSQRQGRRLGCQRLGRWLVALGDRGQCCLEGFHGVVASRLPPTPHRAWAHDTTTRPPQQPGRGRKRHKDRACTA
jgi:hypothetical protein